MDERQVYSAMGFRRRMVLAVVLCMFGLLTYGGFLTFRHFHPISTEPVQVKWGHPTCPHPECIEGHEAFERPVDYATPVLGAGLMIYCAVVGLGAFMVPETTR